MPRVARPRRDNRLPGVEGGEVAVPVQRPPPPALRPRVAFAKIELRGALLFDKLQELVAHPPSGPPGGWAALVPPQARQLGSELRRRLPASLQGPAGVGVPGGGPDRSRLSSVESFFRYTEEEGT